MPTSCEQCKPAVTVWLLAVRPKTLPAAAAPVLVGTARAYAENVLDLLIAMAALSAALLVQIGVNLANDYFDYRNGIDTPDRLGPRRVTQSGLASPASVRIAMMVVFGAAFLVCLFLTSVAGWPVLLIGIVSMLAALAYSGGPYPLASHGLGDLFVFIFFGPVAVCGSYYVQTGSLSWLVAVLSVPVGFLITAILVVNNLRDLHTDAQTGKNTLAVLLGRQGSCIEFCLLVGGAHMMPVGIFLFSPFSAWILLPLFSLPLYLLLMRAVVKTEGRGLNRVLAQSAMLALIYCFLLSVAVIIDG
jgi:1,4-dihydroxy-2-naphthoate octaprenyltransferase